MKFVIVFAGAVALGGWLGWATAGRTPTVAGSAQTQLRPSRDTPRPRATREELLELARAAVEKTTQPGFNPIADELADWTDAEIRNALNESLTDPHAALMEGSAGGLGLGLLGEWMKRDFAGALAWFDALDSRSVKARLVSTLSYRWPPDKAEQGLEFVRKNRDLFTSASPWSIITKAIEQCALRGPGEVNELLRVLREEKFGLDFGNGFSLPPGFDFPALMQGDEIGKLPKFGLLGTLLQAWCAVDREQAFAWVLETKGVPGLVELPTSDLGVAKDRWTWLGAKFQELNASQRTEFLNSMQALGESFSSGAEDFVAGISDPAARMEVGKIAPQFIYSGEAQHAMALLEMISDPASRIQVLEAASPTERFTKSPWLRRFDNSDEALLRKKLAEWNADDARIDAIISRFKP